MFECQYKQLFSLLVLVFLLRYQTNFAWSAQKAQAFNIKLRAKYPIKFIRALET